MAQPCGGEGSENAQRRSEQHQHQSMLENHKQQVASLCSERSADANLAGAASDFIRQQAVHPDTGQQQAQRAEQTKEASRQALIEQQAVDDFGLCFEIDDLANYRPHF